MDKKNKETPIKTDRDFRVTGSDKANQVGPSSPTERTTDQPQQEGFSSSADNDMDRITQQHNLQEDADEAQSDGNISFPEGK